MAVKVTVYGEAKLEQLQRARVELDKLEAQARRNADGFAGAMTRMGESMQTVGQNMTNVGTSMTRNVTVPLAAAGFALFKMTQAAAEDAQAQANLALTLRNTAGATDASIAATENWISAQGRALGVADDQLRPALTILAGATGDVAKAQQLASLAMDISASRGVDLESVSAALAKAYTGNIGALTRLVPGIDAAAVASGDFTQVQAALAEMVGGAAATAADTQAGAMQRAKVAMAEAAETVGTALLPIMQTLADFVANQVAPVIQRIGEWFGSLSERTRGVIIGIAAVAAAIGPLLVVFGTLTSSFGSLLTILPKMGGGMLAALGPIGLIIGALAALVASSPELRELIGNTLTNLMEQLGPVLQQVAAAFAPLIEILGGAFQQIVTALVPIVSTLIGVLADVLLMIVPILADLLIALAPVVAMIAGAFAQVLQAIIPIIVQVIEALMPVVTIIATALLGALQALIDSGFIDMLIGLFTQVMDAVMPLIPLLLELITPLLGLIEPIAQLIGELLPPLVDFLATVIPVAVDIVSAVLTFLIGVIVGLVTAIVTFVVDGVKAIAKFAADVGTNIGRAIDWFMSLPQKIGDALAGAARWLVDTGRNIVEGLLNGIKGAWGAVTKWVGDAIDGLLGGVKDLLGISSPSRVFATIGAQMGEGMRVGLNSTLTAVENAARGVAAAAVVTAAGTVMVGVDAAAAGFPTAGGLPSISAAASSPSTSLQLSAGAIQITIQGDASRDDVRGGVEDALTALLTEVRSR